MSTVYIGMIKDARVIPWLPVIFCKRPMTNSYHSFGEIPLV